MLHIEDIKDNWKSAINQVVNTDCLEMMKLMPDKCVDLVLTDPPYGINAAGDKFQNGNKKENNIIQTGEWDKNIPHKEIFNEIFRISREQIIWGGNYFIENLKNTRCFLIWDKTVHGNSYADCEMAWTSFEENARIKQLPLNVIHLEGRTHPTQKPVILMEWCLTKFSKDTDLILDPFMGSFTTARACKDLGRNFIGCEISEKYCLIGEDRLRQENLF